MRRHHAFLLTLILFSAIASAQSPAPKDQIQFFFNMAVPPVARMSADAVVARILSFDRNNDGIVEKGELPERMQDVVTRGDIGHDGALDDAEIRRLANTRPATFAGRGFRTQGYAFGDEIGLSSRSHIEGALEDLKLDSSTREAALPIVKTFVDNLEVKAFANPTEKMGRLRTQQRLGDAERSALLEQLKGILSEEECDNFRAALERRPLVKAGAVGGVAGGVVNVIQPAALKRKIVDGVVVVPAPAASDTR